MEDVKIVMFALNASFKKLVAGKFWVFLIPGFLFSLLFWGINSDYYSYQNFGETFIEENQSFWDKISHFFTILLYELYKFLVLTLLSPVYCILSEKVDSELTGTTYRFDFGQLILDVIRAVLTIFIALLLNAYVLGIWYFIAFLTGFHQLDQFIYLAISSFFVGYAFLDYSLERDKVGVLASFKFVRQNKLLTLFVGLAFYLVFYIPFIGVYTAPFLITIISTIAYLTKLERIKRDN